MHTSEEKPDRNAQHPATTVKPERMRSHIGRGGYRENFMSASPPSSFTLSETGHMFRPSRQKIDAALPRFDGGPLDGLNVAIPAGLSPQPQE